jgi:hypothetical protein
MENRIENTRKVLKTKDLFGSSELFWYQASRALQMHDKGYTLLSELYRKRAVQTAIRERS